ncbi:B3/B4 domain-containing protein [Actinomadura rubteroloni]|uniref:B3/B4 domain-containing protein n=1 Tax=Actinomadura rubteroloni TaxID=1926885 RepID=UPI000CD82D49|nr:phenylalanine--tRNA ligase beta subunit-related protein [Actinomadura rubteroloni]
MAVEFRVSDHVQRDFPEFSIRLVQASGLRNREAWHEVERERKTLMDRLVEGDFVPFDEGNPEVASWHEAFRRFGTNPRRARPSLDALGRRLAKNGVLPAINPAVDAYNIVSLVYGVPAGAFDLHTLVGSVDLRPAREGDVFHPLGQPGIDENPGEGEVVYATGAQVLTRCWNHRDCDETKVTEDSTDVVFLLERISVRAVPDDRLDHAARKLVDLISPHSDDVATSFLDAGNTRASVGGR